MLSKLKINDNKTKRMKEENEENDIGRVCFQRDRDRILYSKAFRRLNGKTQVFNSREFDHIRTRLTHSLEVSQIATTISKALGLNIYLTEAIALGHDIGHTPFGHTGERTINEILNGKIHIKDEIEINDNYKGFKHNWQSIRVVYELEQLYPNLMWLNLTFHTHWGILNHSKLNREEMPFYIRTLEEKTGISDIFFSLEALIVAVSDEIAQRHHDLEDAFRMKIIDVNEFDDFINSDTNSFDSKNIIRNEFNEKLQNYNNNSNNIDLTIKIRSKIIIDMYVRDIIENMSKKYSNFISIEEILEYNKKEPKIDNNLLSKEFIIFDNKLKDLLKNRILNSYEIQCTDGKANFIIRKLFEAYYTNPNQMPNSIIFKFYDNLYKYKNYEKKKNFEEELNNIFSEVGLMDRKKYMQANNKKFIFGKIRECINKLKYFDKTDYSNDFRIFYKSILFRTIADYISGMTDNYALEQFQKLYAVNDSFFNNILIIF